MTATAIERAVREAGLKSLTPKALSQFEAYLALFLKWNSHLNLTAVREPDEIVRRHFVECIQCAQALPKVVTLLDFGSGAGLPGIPIAICRPEIRVTLGESQGKKAAFLRDVARTLDVAIEVFDRRIEDMPPERHFSAVTLRAVDRMETACRLALPRVEENGWLVLFVTTRTDGNLKSTLPEIEWQPNLAIAGLDEGSLLAGRRMK